ncbi:MAG TPA: hypothetical protein VKU00_13015 [Chthonomonadaceae bacterium]|nr:hypothetical protein [Chthonomonadaceae bacterium]
MPVTVNLPDPNNKKPTPSQSKPDPKSPSKSASAAAGGPPSKNKPLQIALLLVVIVLALGVIGWSQGWLFPRVATRHADADNNPLDENGNRMGKPDDSESAPAGSNANAPNNVKEHITD